MSSKKERPDNIDADNYVSDSCSSDSQVDSDSDYIPDFHNLNPTSDSCPSDYSDEIPMTTNVSVYHEIRDTGDSRLGEVTSTVDTVTVSSPHDRLDSEQGDVTSTIDTVTVQKANNKHGRLWDKKHCCPFCMKMFPKLPRHLEQLHSFEVEVAAVLAFPKKSRERKLRWDDLRNRGNFGHNTQVIKKGSGRIVPYRRPVNDTDVMNYVSCSGCLAFFAKGDLWKHIKSCPKQRSYSSQEKTRPHEHQRASAALLPVSDSATHSFKSHILQAMKHDRISLVVRQDPLIVTFGTKMFAKNGHLVQQHQHIKQKVRELFVFFCKLES